MSFNARQQHISAIRISLRCVPIEERILTWQSVICSINRACTIGIVAIPSFVGMHTIIILLRCAILPYHHSKAVHKLLKTALHRKAVKLISVTQARRQK